MFDDQEPWCPVSFFDDWAHEVGTVDDAFFLSTLRKHINSAAEELTNLPIIRPILIRPIFKAYDLDQRLKNPKASIIVGIASWPGLLWTETDGSP